MSCGRHVGLHNKACRYRTTFVIDACVALQWVSKMEVEGTAIRKLFEKIHVRYGYDFTTYAPDSLTRRSMLFMHNLRIGSWEAFGALVLIDENTFTQFIRFISVTVTEMLRDPIFYSILREHVLQQLHGHPTIRLWVAGCATGEEAYSMAILLK